MYFINILLLGMSHYICLNVDLRDKKRRKGSKTDGCRSRNGIYHRH